jgi:hypothetical protein
MLNIKENYIQEDMYLNIDGSYISEGESDNLNEFNYLIINRHNENQTNLKIFNKNHLKHIKMLIDYKIDFCGDIDKLNSDSFLIKYNIVDHYLLLENKNIDNLKIILKWNVDYDKNLFFVNSLKIIINESCFYFFKHDYIEEKLKLVTMNSIKDLFDPGNFLNDILYIKNNLNLNYGTIKSIYLFENIPFPNIEEVSLIKNGDLILGNKIIHLDNNINMIKVYNLKDTIDFKKYISIHKEIYTFLNKKILNIDFHEKTELLEESLKKINNDPALFLELKNIIEKSELKIESERKEIFKF